MSSEPALAGSVIRRQRLALGLTRHQLAKASGVSWQTLQLVEESLWSENHLLSTVSRLAQALGLRLTDVLTPASEPRSEPADAAIIGTALAAHPDGLTDDVLTRALSWPMQRVQDAIAMLADELRAVGQTIRRVDGHNQLAPAVTALDPHRVQTLARASRPLDPDHARVLLRVLRGHSRNGYWTEYTASRFRTLARSPNDSLTTRLPDH